MNDVKASKNEQISKYVLGLLPSAIFDEITRLCHIGDKRVKHINEIRLRANGPSVVVADGCMLPLHTRLGGEDINNLYMRICKGAPFAMRECIINGYIPLEHGVRVGAVGEARYDDGAIVGVSKISVLVFRLPTGECSFADDLYREWSQRGLKNMLVCSPPSMGKTTALRALVRCLSLDRRDKNVVVVDERCEFWGRDYSDCNVDILSGYKRQRGIDIAVRTMSAHYIVVDEVGRADECEAMLLAYGCGVGILASAHGESYEEIKKRKCISGIIEVGMFPLITLISREQNRYSYRMYEV